MFSLWLYGFPLGTPASKLPISENMSVYGCLSLFGFDEVAIHLAMSAGKGSSAPHNPIKGPSSRQWMDGSMDVCCLYEAFLMHAYPLSTSIFSSKKIVIVTLLCILFTDKVILFYCTRSPGR